MKLTKKIIPSHQLNEDSFELYTDGIFILRKRVTVTNLLVDVYFTF